MKFEAGEEGIPMNTDTPSQRAEDYENSELQQVEISPEVSREDEVKRKSNILYTPIPKGPQEEDTLDKDPVDMWEQDKGKLH